MLWNRQNHRNWKNAFLCAGVFWHLNQQTHSSITQSAGENSHHKQQTIYSVVVQHSAQQQFNKLPFAYVDARIFQALCNAYRNVA